ncbi:hypothetical protein KV557_25625 [Kitasatospora aureofaciens]|uniref:hypothetical protein n=1 Tax=Kitasatospora aureofaciens TaxID=1894 RepID=UPI001C46579D|nr:hypothetical protein [Kitasatospora aureofaciens]MBV6700441.1 hypothetical protein [Kitasatospora aureofaciens]
MVKIADLNGRRYRRNAPGEDPNAVYLVIDSQLRWIANPPTYKNLFPDNEGIYSETFLDDIPGGQVIDGATLARPGNDAAIYLMIDGKKRLIPNPATMDRYHFNWDNVASIPVNAMNDVPTGDPVP